MNSERFSSLWRRCLVAGAEIDVARTFDELVELYSQPHRCYHTMSHIDHCLTQMDVGAKAMGGNDAVEMALWYHDAVYDPRSNDNEQRSAELFTKRAQAVVADGFCAAVCRLIDVTTHRNSPAADDEKFVVDVDLSGFGMPWPEFNDDSARVRRECSHLSDSQFETQQCRFLQCLLDRKSVFSTDFFRDRYEVIARANISRQLAILRSGR